MCCSHILEYRRHFITLKTILILTYLIYQIALFTIQYFLLIYYFFIVCLVYFLLHRYNMYFMTHLTISISCITICILLIIVFVTSSLCFFFLLTNIKSSNLMLCTNFSLIFNLLYEWHAQHLISFQNIIYYIFFLFFTPILNSFLSDKQQKIFIRRRSFSMRV